MRNGRGMKERVALPYVGYEVGEKRRQFRQLAARRQRHRLRLAGRAASVAEAERRIERTVDRAGLGTPVADHRDERIGANLDLNAEIGDAVVDDSARSTVLDLVAV